MVGMKRSLSVFIAVSAIIGCVSASAYAADADNERAVYAPKQSIYANISIPMTDGVTYYFVDPTDDTAVVPGDSFEEILGYINDPKIDQWMSDAAGIEFYKENDNYEIKLNRYTGAKFKIYCKLASNVESLDFENYTVNAANSHDGQIGIELNDNDSGYTSFTMTLTATKGTSESTGSFTVAPTVTKKCAVKLGTVTDGVTVSGLTTDGTLVNHGADVTFQVKYGSAYNITVKANDEEISPTYSTGEADTYTVFGVQNDVTVTVAASEKVGVTFTEEDKKTFDAEDGGDPYTGHFYSVTQTAGDDSASFKIGIRANYMSDGVPYNRYYGSETALTLNKNASVYFGVVAPEGYVLEPYTDLEQDLITTTAGVTAETYEPNND